ncbi:MAG: hypothetical protein ACTSX6_03375 [Candidatus Heimdallarchaeaceae archaeon]
MRKKFLFNEMMCYNVIQESIFKLEQIREIFYIYNQQETSIILLFQVAKRLALIWELYSNDEFEKTITSEDYLQNIFSNSLKKIKREMRKQHSWISLYSYKKKGSKFGFEEIPILKRRKSRISQSSRKYFDNLLEKIRLLANNCLELIKV